MNKNETPLSDKELDQVTAGWKSVGEGTEAPQPWICVCGVMNEQKRSTCKRCGAPRTDNIGKLVNV